jgi:predicted transglutaminase-like cysteine proteinase
MTPVLAPFPWTEFKLARKPSRAEIIAEINARVNAGIRPSRGKPGVNDPWLLWPPVGWCHDYAVTKREELMLRGIASQLCECIAPDNEHHMVLLVDGVALDNLTSDIAPMRYPVVRVQSMDNPDLWQAP